MEWGWKVDDDGICDGESLLAIDEEGWDGAKMHQMHQSGVQSPESRVLGSGHHSQVELVAKRVAERVAERAIVATWRLR